MKKLHLGVSEAVLKIVALSTMTIDHIASIILFNMGLNQTWYYVLMRLIGRAAFPLFVFMVLEGVIHTKDILRYGLRLLLGAILIGLALWVGVLVFHEQVVPGNIFVDLFLAAVALWSLRQKGPWRWLVFAPILYAYAAFQFDWLTTAPMLAPQYGLYGLTMALFFGLGYLMTEREADLTCERYGIDREGYRLTPEYRRLLNVSACISLLMTNAVWYIISLMAPAWDSVGISIQSISALIGILLLYYSGKRGYNAKWFQYGSYAYYPLHLLAIYLLSLIII